MKKILFGVIATVFFGFVGNAKDFRNNQTVNKFNTSVNPYKISIDIHIDWGRVSRNCKGFGICDVTTDISIEFSKVSKFKAINEDGLFSIEFGKDELAEISKHFNSSTTITIEEDYTLNEKLCESLKIKKGYIIKKGKYSINQLKNEAFRVSFK